MKVAITGVTGFIGSRLAMRLKQSGNEIIAIGKVNNVVEAGRKEALAGEGIDLLEGSVTDFDYLEKALAGCDQVFHLAAAQHEANVSEEYFKNINVDGTQNVLEAAIKAGVRRVVHGSTIGVYGEADEARLNEQSPVRPDNHYGRTKLEGEKLALSYGERLPVTVVRISETYGPGDQRLLKLYRAIKKGAFIIAGNGRNLHQLIYVDDLIDGLIAAGATEGAEGEVIILAGSEELTTNEMCAQVASAIKAAPPRIRLPLWPFLLLAVILEFSFGRIGVQPPLHRRRLDFFRKSFLLDCSKARQHLDFSPRIDFAEGSRLTGHWYKKQGLL